MQEIIVQETSTKNRWKVEKFWKYLQETRPDVKVIKCTLSSHQMKSLFDKDVHDYFNTSILSGLSEIIDEYNTTDLDQREWFISETHSGHWSSTNENLYSIYQLFKITWLTKDIRKNGVQAPVQLLKTVESYHCHPGSDKKYALTVLDQIPAIPCFYIWYPELDPCPFFEQYEYQLINSPQEFIDMFPMADDSTFDFEWGKVDVVRETDEVGAHPDWKGMDHFYAFAHNVCEILRKKELRSFKNTKVKEEPFQNWTCEHLSYHDSIHRRQMEQEKNIVNNIGLIDETTFNLNGDIFKWTTFGESSLWLPESFNNFPTSLIDSNWKHIPERSLSFNLEYLAKVKGIM